MKKFNHVEIHRENSELLSLLDKMKSLQNQDFSYNEELSQNTNEDTKSDSICGGILYAVFTTTKDELFNTNVFVSVKGDELKVFNMTSNNEKYWDLGVTRYNLVMSVFFHHFMAKCLDESYNGCVEMTGETQDMREIIGEKAFDALNSWEKTCNKDAPTSNYYDEQAWFAFLSILYNEGKELHPEDFESWLIEDCHWSSYYNEVINQLGLKLEYSQSLLKYYDEHSSR